MNVHAFIREQTVINWAWKTEGNGLEFDNDSEPPWEYRM